jgi:hypothetical protein
MTEEVKKMTESEVTDEELALAKDSYLNSFVFNFDSKSEIVSRLMMYEYFGYPADFLQKIKENVEKVTKRDVLRVAQEHLRPEKMQILAVGRPQDFDEPLSVLGKVRKIDITIPEPKEQLPTATAETTAKGRELLEEAVAACGGAEAFAAIENFVGKNDMTIVTPGGEMQVSAVTTFVLPDKFHQVLTLPMGEMKQVVVQEKAWMVAPQGTVDMPDSQKKQIQSGMFRDLVNLFRMSRREALDVRYLGTDDVNNRKTEIISVTGEGTGTVKLFLDAETFVPLKQAYKGMTMTGPADMEQFYSDLRAVSGIKLPFSTVIYANGDKYVESKVTAVEINAEIDPSIFEKQ